MDEAIDMTITMDCDALMSLIRAHFERDGYEVICVHVSSEGERRAKISASVTARKRLPPKPVTLTPVGPLIPRNPTGEDTMKTVTHDGITHPI